MALLRECLRELRAFQGDDTFALTEDMRVVSSSGYHVGALEPRSDAHIEVRPETSQVSSPRSKKLAKDEA